MWLMCELMLILTTDSISTGSKLIIHNFLDIFL